MFIGNDPSSLVFRCGMASLPTPTNHAFLQLGSDPLVGPAISADDQVPV